MSSPRIVQQNKQLGKGKKRGFDGTDVLCYCLRIMCDTLTRDRIEEALSTVRIGHPAYFWETIGSTMDEARRLAQAGAPDGALVLADEQTAGRGRLERTWWAPAGTSLLMTLVLRPNLLPRQAQRLTVLCSLAVCDAIVRVCGIEARVKWPNDVLIDGKKVCGVLTELGLFGDRLEYALVGMGINVNLDLADAPPLMVPATSLLLEGGVPSSRLDLLVALLSGIERRYEALQAGVSFHEEWSARLVTIGQNVRARSGEEQWHGLATGVDEDGALLIRLEDGAVQRVLAGDVTLLAPHEEAWRASLPLSRS
jgi:BirA family biotin operon repressor/biotin-[acetyl-CoA-carboxylase] ligase